MAVRNTAYQFITTDTTEIEGHLIDIYEIMMDTTVRRGSPDMLFIKWIANLFLYQRNAFNQLMNQNLPSRATGDDLDALAEAFYQESRPDPTAASCTMRFHISQAQNTAILVPEGTRVTDAASTLYWELREDLYIPAGSLYVDGTVYCQTAGAVGNDWIAGDINTIVDVYDFYTSCENLTDSDGGSDSPEDDAFYELLRLSLDALSTAGAKGAYEYYTLKTSSEISNVLVNSPIPGYVYVYAMTEDGAIATEELKARILATLSEDLVRPLTDRVVVSDPGVVHYNVDLTYYIPSNTTLSSAEIAANVQAAVEKFRVWQTGKLGRDINPSKLISLLMETGVKRVVVREPAFTPLQDGILSDGYEYDLEDTIPQVGICDTEDGDTITLVNGGVEDE